MSHPSNYPFNSRYASILQHNPATDEPFISLPAPHSNIRLTPARISDIDAIPPIMNSPEVALSLNSPPFPFLREHGRAWLQDSVRDYESAMVHIRNADENVGYIGAFPLRHIREVGSDGLETFLGDVRLNREGRFESIDDTHLREAKITENASLPPGDPNIVWSFGDYISPTHHGRGIMTAIINTVIWAWAVPHMNARKYHVATFTDNIGSQRVFLKNDFKFVSKAEGVVAFPRSKGGHVKDCYCYHLEIPVDPNDGSVVQIGC